MDALADKLSSKLQQWQPEIAEQVRQSVSEIIEMADLDTLDILRSRVVEQEVLDLLDEPEIR
jgi:exonuclease V gamma subunit